MTEHDLHAQGWQPRQTPGFMATAGPLWTRREGDGWAYGLWVQAPHLNPAGLMHGGALLTLVDHALSAVAWQASERTPCLTLQLDTHFMAAVQADAFVEVRAQLSHRTRGLLFLRGHASVGEQTVLQAQAVLKIAGAPRSDT